MLSSSRTKSLAETTALTLSAHIAQLGGLVEIRSDFDAWVAFMRGRSPVNPAFDPQHHDLSEAFWIRLSVAGETVGTVATKHLHGSFFECMRSGELWFGRNAGPEHRIELNQRDNAPELSGELCYYGALWLDQSCRGTGLSGLMSKLNRCIGMSRWTPDWNCGGVFQPIAAKQLPKRVYGYPNCERVAHDIWFPPTGRREDIFTPWESRDEWAEIAQGWMLDTVETLQPTLRPASGWDEQRPRPS
jgi:hypothetical protein